MMMGDPNFQLQLRSTFLAGFHIENTYSCSHSTRFQHDKYAKFEPTPMLILSPAVQVT